MKIPSLSKKCLVCGDIFCKKTTESKTYWLTKKYCSNKCSLKETTVQKVAGNYWKGKIMTDEIRKKVSDACKGRKASSTTFKKGHIPWIKGKKLPQTSGKNNFNWKPKVKKSCSYCSKELQLAPNQVRTRNFCNRQCWALGTRGEGSPVFLGDKATKPLRQRIMAMDEYKNWRNGVLTRDDWRCQVCGHRNKKGLLRKQYDVDHIKKYSVIVKEYGIKTLEQARNCQELWDISNGRTLCKECHRTSNTYGRK